MLTKLCNADILNMTFEKCNSLYLLTLFKRSPQLNMIVRVCIGGRENRCKAFNGLMVFSRANEK